MMPQAARTLIVDDELFVAFDIEQMVQELGCESVGIARDASEAIELAFALKPELILMDVNLGAGKSGIAAAHEILAKQPSRIIFVTAYRDESNLAKMREVSSEPVLSKPLSIDRLRAALQR